MNYKTLDHGELQERFEAPQAYVGYAVLDAEGRKIGSVQELFVNAIDEPEYVKVKMGLFGLRSALIPVQLVAADTQRRVLLLR